tara:strand:+ start:1719 stop:1985 length:267 start_codon:yes stop_codon:yes gene_type:complete
MKTPNGEIQYVILQHENPVAFTGDQNFARLVIDLLETHRTPAFQEALAEVAKRSNQPVEEPVVEVEDDDDYEKKKAERLASLEEEEEV